EYSDKGLLKIVSKEQLKKNYGKSPDVSDAVALTFFEKLYSRNNTNEDWSYDGW
ncbi:terminase, partial [Campylobacter coli]|nr:terminase [Campylobacter coli]